MTTIKTGALGALLTIIGILYQPAYACGCDDDDKEPQCLVNDNAADCMNPCSRLKNGSYKMTFKSTLSEERFAGAVACNGGNPSGETPFKERASGAVAVFGKPISGGMEYSIFHEPGSKRVAYIQRFDDAGMSRFDFRFKTHPELCTTTSGMLDDEVVINFKTGKLFTGTLREPTGNETEVIVVKKGRIKKSYFTKK